MFSSEQYHQFHRDGFLVVPRFLTGDEVSAARARFEPLFRGEFETGLQPDEWNWREGVDDPARPRQICNGWKSDPAIARVVLSTKVGEGCARLMDWDGARINQDNVIWKPPGAKAFGFHQDDSYQQWVVPPSMITCWMALDDTSSAGGTIEYAVGSNHWPVATEKYDFHAPEDYHEGLKVAASSLGVGDYKVQHIEVGAGSAVFHHGGTWHGSGANTTDKPRRSLVAHCMSANSRFHENIIGPIYGRYRKFDSTEMDECFFPVLWRRDGHRSKHLDRLLHGF